MAHGDLHKVTGRSRRGEFRRKFVVSAERSYGGRWWATVPPPLKPRICPMHRSSLASSLLLTALCFAPARADASKPDPSANNASEDETEGDPAEASAKQAKAKKAKKSKTKKSKTKKSKAKNDEACDFRSPIYWHEVEAGRAHRPDRRPVRRPEPGHHQPQPEAGQKPQPHSGWAEAGCVPGAAAA